MHASHTATLSIQLHAHPAHSYIIFRVTCTPYTKNKKWIITNQLKSRDIMIRVKQKQMFRKKVKVRKARKRKS